jgi:hypothetical protein
MPRAEGSSNMFIVPKITLTAMVFIGLLSYGTESAGAACQLI